MNNALNILKIAALYTGLYALFCMVYWIVIITLAIFWKPIATFFCIALALLGIEYFVKRRALLKERDTADMADWRAMNGISS